MTRTRRWQSLFAGIYLALFCAAPPVCLAEVAGAAARSYQLGVFPFMPMANIEGLFAPLSRDIGAALARQVLLISSPSFETMIDDIKQARFEIAFVQPFDYVKFAKPAGYLPVAARADTLASIVVVKEGSPVKSLKQLKGKTIGMPPEVAAVSYLNKYLLKNAGLKPGTDVQLKFLLSHMACLQELLIGTVDACGISPPTMRLAREQLKAAFTIIARSPTIPSPLFVVKASLPRKERETITRVLVTTTLESVQPELRQMFYAEGEKKPFIATTDKAYDPIRKLLQRIEP